MTSRTTVLSDRDVLRFHKLYSSDDDDGTTSEENSVDEEEYAQFLKLYKPPPMSIPPEMLIVIGSTQTKKTSNTHYPHAIKNSNQERRIRKFGKETNPKKVNEVPIVTVPVNNRYKQLEVTSDEYESDSSEKQDEQLKKQMICNDDSNTSIFSPCKNNSPTNWVLEQSGFDITYWAEDIHVISNQKKKRKRRRSTKKRKSQSLQHSSSQEKHYPQELRSENKYTECIEPLTNIPVETKNNYEAPNMTPYDYLQLRIEEVVKSNFGQNHWFDQVCFVDNNKQPGSDQTLNDSHYCYENFSLQCDTLAPQVEKEDFISFGQATSSSNLCSEHPYIFNSGDVDIEEVHLEKVIVDYSLLQSQHVPCNNYNIFNNTSKSQKLSFIKGTFNKFQDASKNYIEGLDRRDVLLVFGVLLGSYTVIKKFK